MPFVILRDNAEFDERHHVRNEKIAVETINQNLISYKNNWQNSKNNLHTIAHKTLRRQWRTRE
jgi:hypothetical protein